MALEDARTAFGGRIEGAFAPDFEPVARSAIARRRPVSGRGDIRAVFREENQK